MLETSTQRQGSRKLIPISALLLSLTVLGMVENIAGSALPILQREIGFSVEQAALAISIFGLASLATIGIAGKLSDVFQAKHVAVVAMLLAVVGAAMCSFADNFSVVIVAYVLLGAGGSALAAGLATLRAIQGDSKSSAMGWFVGAVTLGGSLGAILSGPLTDTFSRAAVFLVPAAALLLTIVLFAVLVPKFPREFAEKSRFDYLGLVLFVITLLALQLFLSQFSSGAANATLVSLYAVVMVACFVLFLVVQRRAENPFLDLKLLKQPVLAGSGLLAVLAGLSYSGGYFLLQQIALLPSTEHGPGLGLSFSEITLYTAPGIMLGIVTAPFSAWLIKQWGLRWVSVLGIATLVAGALVLLLVQEGATWPIILSGVLVIGLGGATLYTVAVTGVEMAVPASEFGVSSAMVLTSRGVGFVAGPVITGLLLKIGSDEAMLPTYTGLYAALAGISILGLLGFTSVRYLPTRSTVSLDTEPAA